MTKFFRLTNLFLLSFLCIHYSGNSQTKLTEHVYRHESGGSYTKALISDFSRLTGYWKGEGLGGICEELWMPPSGGIMHGSFRMETNGKLYFSEFMTITIDTAGLAVLKVKHFNPDFTGWEEKNKSEDFQYLKSDNNAIYFSGMTYAFDAADRLSIYVVFKTKDGKHEEQKFVFKKFTL